MRARSVVGRSTVWPESPSRVFRRRRPTRYSSAISSTPRPRLAEHGIKLLIEPVDTYDIPGFFLSHTAQALRIMDEVNHPNLYLQYDVYHMQVMEGNLAATIRNNLARIVHIQIADVPGRHEPGTGEINYPFLFQHLDSIGYTGWVGCEDRRRWRRRKSVWGGWHAISAQPHTSEGSANESWFCWVGHHGTSYGDPPD
jgi:hydroxypyruvate isomerase